jgi:adenine specific DNA methylase Mod
MTQQERWEKGFPDIPFCEIKHRLISEFTLASHELMALQNQQTQAVINQDPDFSRFDDLIHMAREKKDTAKYALIAHIDEHQC